ncbi:MAG: sigma-70 family RNA polymerase sigma factor [Acidimicrobiales bacterium]|nr:sigma-70 family RNA polymerase sigma factor [Acidimicrobiales bacterium]
MSPVALPSSAPSLALATEADLVRRASRQDRGAFRELYRRHSRRVWRLAQVVAPDRSGALKAFSEGFARAVRGAEVAPHWTFRQELLAAVYRSGADYAPRPAALSAASVETLFGSLPLRWRTALWLSEVEGYEPSVIAAVLGVSTSMAAQLVARSRRGLANRFAQANEELAEPIGALLLTLASSPPPELAEAAESRWASAPRERAPVLVPATAWLEAKAVRPMSVAVGALIGLALIGVGTLQQGSTLRSNLGGGGANGSLSGSVPVHVCSGPRCASSGSGTTASVSFSSGPFPSGPLSSGPLSSGAISLSPVPGPATTPPTSTPAGASGPTLPPGGGSSPTPTPTPAPRPPVSVTGGSTIQVNLLPTGSGSAASATAGSGGVAVSVGGTTVVGVTTPTTTVPSIVNNVTNTVSGLTKGL